MDSVAQGGESVGFEEVGWKVVEFIDGFVEYEFADGVVEVVDGDADIAFCCFFLFVDEGVDTLDGFITH